MGWNQAVLLNLIEQGPIANAEQPSRGFAVPVGLFEGMCNGATLGLALCASHQGLQRRLLFARHVKVLAGFVPVSIAGPVSFSSCQLLTPVNGRGYTGCAPSFSGLPGVFFA